MPVYEYLCEANKTLIEVLHPMTETVKTWDDLCKVAGIEPGDTPADAPVTKQLYAPGISAPVGDSKLKNMGFTKLVKRETGVYENVTATGTESRYMKAGDDSTMPHINKKISD